MAKYLDWYLVELEKSLEKSTRPEELHALLSQTEDHILMLKFELMRSGMNEDSAEQAAVQRFGDLENLVGKTETPKVKQGNWAAPVLVLVGTFVLLTAALLIGSYRSIAIAGGTSACLLFLSALLCMRRGAFPGLAFGLVLMTGFGAVSGVAGWKFTGADTMFVKDSEAPAMLSALKQARPKIAQVANLYRLGERYVQAGHSDDVPDGLQTPQGILCPSGATLEPDLTSQFTPMIEVSRLLTPYEEIGRTRSTSTAYEAWKNNLFPGYWSAMSGPKGIQTQWVSDPASGVGQWVERQDLIRADFLIQHLENRPGFQDENLFGGLAAGAIITTLWMLISVILCGLANFDPPKTAVRHQRQTHLA